MLDEIDHDLFQCPLFHLTVSDGDASFGHEAAQAGFHLVDITDAIVEK